MKFCLACCRSLHSQGSMRSHQAENRFTRYWYGSRPFRVLIFDDSPFECEAILMLCEEVPSWRLFEVEVASTEEEAFVLLKNSAKFDLILVDYHQPHPFDCIEFLRRIGNLGTAVALISADDKIEYVYRYADVSVSSENITLFLTRARHYAAFCACRISWRFS